MLARHLLMYNILNHHFLMFTTFTVLHQLAQAASVQSARDFNVVLAALLQRLSVTVRCAQARALLSFAVWLQSYKSREWVTEGELAEPAWVPQDPELLHVSHEIKFIDVGILMMRVVVVGAFLPVGSLLVCQVSSVHWYAGDARHVSQ